MIKWNDKYSVNVSIIDKQHKNIPEEILKILNDMIMYARRHFKTEETYMKKSEYLGYQSHKNEHQKFSLMILSYRIKLTNSNYPIVNDILIFLQRWLVKHIQNSDQKYIDCFIKNGLK